MAIGNQEEALNEMYWLAIRLSQPRVNFRFERASYVGEFIALTSRPDTHLALFIPPGNLKQGARDPVPTPDLDAAGIVRAIKARRVPRLPHQRGQGHTHRHQPGVAGQVLPPEHFIPVKEYSGFSAPFVEIRKTVPT
jgi:hypothetical protein